MSFEGVGGSQENQVVAKQITFDEDDLALAQVIQAGINPTAQQQAQNMATYSSNKQATDASLASNQAAIDNANREIQPTSSELMRRKPISRKWKNQRISVSPRWVKSSPRTNTPCSSKRAITAYSQEAKQGIANIAKQGLAYTKGWGISVAGYRLGG